MNENEKLNEVLDYAKWMLENLDPDDMYNFCEVRKKILELIGYITIIKG